MVNGVKSGQQVKQGQSRNFTLVHTNKDIVDYNKPKVDRTFFNLFQISSYITVTLGSVIKYAYEIDVKPRSLIYSQYD